MKARAHFKRPRIGARTSAFLITDLCRHYGWPTAVKVEPQVIVIGELGGAAPSAIDIATWAAQTRLPGPKIGVYGLPGADTSSSDADGEVALDWQMAAGVWSWMTGTPAKIILAYGPNSGQAFADVMNYASTLPNLGAGSWSWGSPEDQWIEPERQAVNAAGYNAAVPWTAASGDNDADDGESHPVTDFPAASPYVVGCGGTTLAAVETVWNNGFGEGTGGGFSRLYPRPSWQTPNSQGDGRMVPDCAADADPHTGHLVVINGQWQTIGGTSAVAPMVAAFLAVVNGARVLAGLPKLNGQTALPALWAAQASFYDVTQGNNGAYRATVGPDPCTGLGRPLGTLLAALTGATLIPAPTPAPPVPQPSWWLQLILWLLGWLARRGKGK